VLSFVNCPLDEIEIEQPCCRGANTALHSRTDTAPPHRQPPHRLRVAQQTSQVSGISYVGHLAFETHVRHQRKRAPSANANNCLQHRAGRPWSVGCPVVLYWLLVTICHCEDSTSCAVLGKRPWSIHEAHRNGAHDALRVLHVSPTRPRVSNLLLHDVRIAPQRWR
jgi:hypothetical protein